jgi:4-amino-4-deoxy-L-arabinose transferase-like glycosyltransferase
MTSRFAVLAAAILCLAAFNLTFRQHVHTIQHWDESLYAMTAWEMLQSGDLVGTTFLGELDYYNTKPPLNVWLIALSFRLFGVNAVALRLPSMLAAMATIAVILYWARRHLGARPALLGGLVLSTLFAFHYVHASRTANTDAINTLLIVLVVITLWGAREQPWRLAWLGPLMAATFLLRGMAILLPLAIVGIDEFATFGLRRRGRWLPTAAATVLFAVPVGAWMIARWRLDQWKFLSRLFWYDFVARSVTPIEDHPGSVFFYLDFLQRHHYGWLFAAITGVLLFPPTRAVLRALLAQGARKTSPARLLLVWAALAFLIPTMMRTKVGWYLHPFYPVFAVGVGAILDHGMMRAGAFPAGWRSWRVRTLVSVVALVACAAEAQLVWQAYHRLDFASSSQGVLLAERERLRGQTIYRRRIDRSEIFVIHAMVGGTHRLTENAAAFVRDARSGDYYLTRLRLDDPRLAVVRKQGDFTLYRKLR